MEYFRKGSAASHLSVEDYHADYFASARHLHLSGVAAALSASSYELLDHAATTMKTQGKTISFDPNLRPVLWKSEAEMVEAEPSGIPGGLGSAGRERRCDPHR